MDFQSTELVLSSNLKLTPKKHLQSSLKSSLVETVNQLTTIQMFSQDHHMVSNMQEIINQQKDQELLLKKSLITKITKIGPFQKLG